MGCTLKKEGRKKKFFFLWMSKQQGYKNICYYLNPLSLDVYVFKQFLLAKRKPRNTKGAFLFFRHRDVCAAHKWSFEWREWRVLLPFISLGQMKYTVTPWRKFKTIEAQYILEKYCVSSLLLKIRSSLCRIPTTVQKMKKISQIFRDTASVIGRLYCHVILKYTTMHNFLKD